MTRGSSKKSEIGNLFGKDRKKTAGAGGPPHPGLYPVVLTDPAASATKTR